MPLAAIILFIGLTAAACGGAAPVGTDAPAPATTTAPHALADALLTAAELRPAAGAFVRRPMSATSRLADPDPRAPCGARVSQPSLRRGAVVEFRSKAPAAELFQWVDDLRPMVAARLLGAFERDVRRGCPAFRTATPYGHPQLNQFIRALHLPPLGDERVAVTMRLRLIVAGARAAYATEIMIREGERLTVITLVGLRPQSPRVVRAIAERAAADIMRVASAASEPISQ